MINNWTTSTLEQLAQDKKHSIVDGPFGSNLKLSDYVSEGVPVLQGNNITGNSFKFTDIRFISDEKAKDLIRSKVIVGDLLIVKIGSVGYSAIINDLNGYDYAIIPANLMKVSLDKNKVIPEYVYQYLTSTNGVNSLRALASSTAQPALSLSKVKRLTIPHPKELKIQQKITEILSVIDQGIAKTDQIIQKTEKLKQGLMNELLTKGIGHKKFKKTKLGEIPEGWEIKPLSASDIKIIDGDRGVNYPKKSDFTKEGYCLFLNNKNIKDDSFVFDEPSFISKGKDEKLSKGKLQRQDIVLTTRGSVGNVSHYNDSVPYEHIRLNSGMVILRSGKQFSPSFVYFLFRSPQFKAKMTEISSGSAQPQLPIKSLNHLLIPKPSIDEQNHIIQVLSAVEFKLMNNRKEKNHLMDLKKGLMQDLFSQKVQIN